MTLRTPESWSVQELPSRPGVAEASGDDLVVRLVYRKGEPAFDALHADCLLERLAPPMEVGAEIAYEYDFVSGQVGERRALDSAFRVEYDEPVRGQRVWRQRSLTLVGLGSSLCLNAMAPARKWKSSSRTRELAAAVLSGLSIR